MKTAKRIYRTLNLSVNHQLRPDVHQELAQCETLLQVCNVLNSNGYAAEIIDGTKRATATALDNHVIGSVFGRPVVKVERI